jgi:basic membrane protein A
MGKNTVRLMLVLVLVVSLVAGCAQSAAGDITLGLVTDIGGIDDKSFNQGTWEGIERFAVDYNLAEEDYKYIQSESDADYLPNLQTYSDAELDLIVAPGFLFFDAMTEIAAQYPEQKFLLIDSVVEAGNVASAVFAEHEGSFLVGVAAALKAQDAGQDTVAFLGGMDFGLIQKFEAGFEAGVYAVDPTMEVLVDYAGAFNDSQKGQTIAAKFYNQGAYIIYHAAGGTGNGAIKEAKDRVLNGEDVWVIGVDKDQYEDGIYEDGKSIILTSMMKRVDVAAYTVAEQVLNEEFTGGTLVFQLSNDGVGIPTDNPNLTDEWTTMITEYADQVIAGDIVVPEVPARVK